jgi:hypothetical protein
MPEIAFPPFDFVTDTIDHISPEAEAIRIRIAQWAIDCVAVSIEALQVQRRLDDSQ